MDHIEDSPVAWSGHTTRPEKQRVSLKLAIDGPFLKRLVQLYKTAWRYNVYSIQWFVLLNKCDCSVVQPKVNSVMMHLGHVLPQYLQCFFYCDSILTSSVAYKKQLMLLDSKCIVPRGH